MMSLVQFEHAVEKLQAHFKEREDLEAALKVLAPTGTHTLEFGSWFIDAYIWAVEVAVDDGYNWFSWFVFENDFGAKGLTIRSNGVEIAITDAKIFYEVVYA